MRALLCDLVRRVLTVFYLECIVVGY